MKTMLKIRNLEAGYGKLKVLKRISMHVALGEIVTILGANGAGKTTLLHSIAGIVRPHEGEILLKDNELRKLPAHRVVGQGVALVPEGRQVFATMTVSENLHLGGYLSFKNNKDKAHAQLAWILELFPVLKERENQLAGTLSGGEQQMLAMGRALMTMPELIMMDEPSTGLAPLIVKDIFSVIAKLRDAGNTVLLVEQNARAALHLADRGYVMETGKFIVQGPADELLENRDVQRAYLGRDVDSES